MTYFIALQKNTVLANVRYKWISGGVASAEQTLGITQPNPSFAVFRIQAAVPENTEEILGYDSTDTGNWNTHSAQLGINN